MTQLSKKARDRKLTPEEMEADFHHHNLGGSAAPVLAIVNHPEVAILAFAFADGAGVGEQQIRARLILPLSLSYDHRLIDARMRALSAVDRGGV